MRVRDALLIIALAPLALGVGLVLWALVVFLVGGVVQ